MTSDAIRVSELVHRSAARYPDRIAVQNLSGSRRMSYSDLRHEVERGAAALVRHGLTAGDRVLIAAPSGPDWIAAFLSVAHADLVAVPIPVATPPPLARLAAVHTGARAWIGDPNDEAPVSALAGIRRVTLNQPSRPHATAPDRPVRPGATAVLVFTSGSTARPRAVALSHDNLRANLRSIMAVRQAAPDEAVLSTLPPSHAYELVAGQLAPLAVGARIVYGGPLLPNRLVEGIRTQAVTRAVLVPALFDALVDELFDRLATKGIVDPGCRRGPPAELAASLSGMDPPALARVRDAVRMELGPSFRTVVIGGAAASPAWADVLTAVGIDLDLGYGLTEAGPVVALGRAAECPPGSVGRPLPGVRVRIADDGEVLVSSDAIMQEYAGDASATARAFEGRWLRTGDRGRLDDDGFLFITGRLKDAMVTSSGETIYPDEIEPWYSSPLFAELAVVPLPGPDGNDRPVLVVVPSDPSSGIVTMKRAMAALRAAAPARLRVAGVVSRAEPLPRTAVGKIRRQALAAGCQAHEVCS